MHRCEAECQIGQPQGSMVQVLCLFQSLLLRYGGKNCAWSFSACAGICAGMLRIGVSSRGNSLPSFRSRRKVSS